MNYYFIILKIENNLILNFLKKIIKISVTVKNFGFLLILFLLKIASEKNLQNL